MSAFSLAPFPFKVERERANRDTLPTYGVSKLKAVRSVASLRLFLRQVGCLSRIERIAFANGPRLNDVPATLAAFAVSR